MKSSNREVKGEVVMLTFDEELKFAECVMAGHAEYDGADAAREIISICKQVEREKKSLLQIVIEDVPHEYQKRLVVALSEPKIEVPTGPARS